MNQKNWNQTFQIKLNLAFDTSKIITNACMVFYEELVNQADNCSTQVADFVKNIETNKKQKKDI